MVFLAGGCPSTAVSPLVATSAVTLSGSAERLRDGDAGDAVTSAGATSAMTMFDIDRYFYAFLNQRHCKKIFRALGTNTPRLTGIARPGTRRHALLVHAVTARCDRYLSEDRGVPPDIAAA